MGCRGGGLREPDADVHLYYGLQLSTIPLVPVFLTYMLGHAIPPGEAGRTTLKRTINAEFANMDSNVFPCGASRALGKPTLVQLANLPTTFRPVNF